MSIVLRFLFSVALAGSMIAGSCAFAQNPPIIANDIVDGQRRESGNQDGPAGTRTPQEQQAQQGQQKNTRNAEALLLELENLTPGKVEPGTDLHKAYTESIAVFLTGNGDGAAKILKEHVESNPTMPPVELLIAGMLYAVNETERGQLVLESLAIAKPDYPGIYVAFARLAINQGRFTDAQALLEKSQRKIESITMEPVEKTHFETQLYDAMTEVAMRQRRYEDARVIVQKLANVSPDYPKAILALAELDFQDEKIDSSLDHLKKFHQLQKNSRVPELVMATWYGQDGKLEEAGSWIEKASKTYPDNAAVQIEYANYCVNTEKFALASNAIKAVEAKVGESIASALLKAKIAFASESYGMAEFHYEKIANAQKNNFDASNMYALSLVESDSEDKQKLALQIAQRNFQQLQNNQVAMAALGWIMLKTGQTEEAATLLGRAARAPDLSPEIAYFLATYMQQSGKAQQAKLVLEPALARQGFFLYRVAAEKLMKMINTEIGGDSLPDPNGNDSDK